MKEKVFLLQQAKRYFLNISCQYAQDYKIQETKKRSLAKYTGMSKVSWQGKPNKLQ